MANIWRRAIRSRAFRSGTWPQAAFIGGSTELDIEMGFAFAPDGKSVVTGGRNFRYWDIARGQEIKRYPLRPRVAAVAFAPDGKTLVTAAGLILQLWDASTGREIPRFQGSHPFQWVLYPKDGKGRENRKYGRQPTIEAMAIAPDGKTLASGAGDGSIWVWDIGTGRAIRPVQGLKGSFTAIAFAPDGKAFAAAEIAASGLGTRIPTRCSAAF